jgi:predicted small metal-binding protein
VKAINCRDVGVDCDYEARGNTPEEMMQKLTEHARSVHNMREVPPDLQTKARKAMRDVPEQQRRGA